MERRQKEAIIPVLFLSLLVLGTIVLGADEPLNDGKYIAFGEHANLRSIDDIDVSSGSSGTLDAMQVNFTGTNTTALQQAIANVTLWNTTDGATERVGFNDTPSDWESSGSGFLFNISSGTTFTSNNTELTLNVTVGSSGDGSEIEFTLLKIFGGVEDASTNSLSDGNARVSGRVTVDESPPNITVMRPADSANISNITGDTGLNVSVIANTAKGDSSPVDTGSVQYIFQNSTGNFSAAGAEGAWTGISQDAGTTYNTTFSTDTLAEGWYEIFVRANDTVDIGASNQRAAQFSNITIDRTKPDGITDLKFGTGPPDNRSNLNTNSPLVYQTLNSEAFQLVWTDTTSDSLTGVKKMEFLVRNRSFNASKQDMNSWNGSDWYTVNESVNPSSEVLEDVLSTNYQYRFNLSTFDFANNSNSSNIINVTLDTSPPEMAKKADGTNISTPISWTDSKSFSPSINITDVAGIYRRPHQNYSTKYVNLTFWNATGSGPDKLYTNVSLAPDTNRSAEYRVDAVNSFGGLQNMTTYNVSVRATDILENTGTFNWTFQTDFNTPTSVSSNTSQETWLKGPVPVEVDCTDDSAGSRESGPDEVEIEGAWDTGWKQSVPAVFHLDKNGKNNATLKCRDRAGNVNSTLQEEYWIDTNAPKVDSFGDTTDVATDGSIDLTLSQNESDESGINTGASKFWIENGGGSVNPDYGGGKVIQAKFSNLDSGEDDYELHYWIIDNVGHNVSDHINFDTQSSGGGGGGGGSGGGGGGGGGGTTLQSSMALQSVPESTAVNQGQNTTISFTLENTGDTDLSGVAVNATLPALSVSVSDTGFDIPFGGAQNVSIAVTVPADAPTGIYVATINATADDGTTTATTVDVEVLVVGTALAIRDTPGDVSVAQGNQTTVPFDVKNSGDETATADFTFAAPNMSTNVSPPTADIQAGDIQTAEVTIEPAASTPVGVYNGTFTATAGDEEGSAQIDVKVQPDSAEEQEAIESAVGQLEQRLQEQRDTLNQSRQAEIQGLISQANTALEQEDYATAAELQQRIEEELGVQGDGLDLPLLPIGIAAVVLAIAGLLAYLVLPAQEGEAGQTARRAEPDSTWRDMGPVRPSKQGGQEYEYQDSGGTLDTVQAAVTQAAAGVGDMIDRVADRLTGGAGRTGEEDLRPAVRRQKRKEESGERDDFDYDFTDRN